MKIISTLILTFLALSAYAQNTSNNGEITFEEVTQVKANFKTDDPRMADLKDMLPDSRKAKKSLKFKDGKSLYTAIKNETKEDQQITNNSTGLVTMKFEEPENNIFYNSEEKSTVQQKSFMNRIFLISGQEEKKWKITSEKKEILGYQCTKAVLNDSSETSAWFTSQIPVFTGPDTYNGLPGLILEVNIVKTHKNIIATEISLGTVNEDLEIPSSGKKVTVKQYKKIMEKKMEEMKQEFGGKNGSFMIIKEEQ